MLVDGVLIGLLVLGFLVGFFRGVIRGLLTIAAWGICFVFAVYLRAPVGDWLGKSASFSLFYADMIAFAVIFFALFGALVLVTVLSRAPTDWTRHALLDDILGGLAGVVTVVLVIATVIVIIDSYYIVEAPPVAVDIGWHAELHRALAASAIGTFVSNNVLPFLGFILGPILPTDIRGVMA